MLAVPVASSGTVVSTERLTDALGGDQPPRSSHNVLHNLVIKLRQRAGERCQKDAAGRLRPPGWGPVRL